MTLDELRERLPAAWSRATSSLPEYWTPDLPEIGQCAVTALVVQDELGGDLLRCINGSSSHYYNWVPLIGFIDLTRGQFTSWEPTDVGERTRDYLLSNDDTRTRYERLLAHLAAAASA